LFLVGERYLNLLIGSILYCCSHKYITLIDCLAVLVLDSKIEVILARP